MLGSKECSRCGVEKDLDGFQVDRRYDRPKAECKDCLADRQRDFKRQNPDYHKRWYADNANNAHSRYARSLKVDFGLSWDDYQMLVYSQGGVCKLCGTKGPRRLSVDHDHRCCPGGRSCGKCVRQLLCQRCNLGLGQLRDDPQLLRRAADYIDWHAAKIEVAQCAI